jgi:hypothetical protein
MQNSAPGLRHSCADSKANCNPRANAKREIADCEANSASNRHAKTNSNAYEPAISFLG